MGAVPAVTVPVGHHCVLVAEPAVDDGVCWLHPAEEDRVESAGGRETRKGGKQAGWGPRGWRCRQVKEGAGDAMNPSTGPRLLSQPGQASLTLGSAREAPGTQGQPGYGPTGTWLQDCPPSLLARPTDLGPFPGCGNGAPWGISRWKGPWCSQKSQESQGHGDQGWGLQTAA